jgi:hypothetical protein
MAHELAVWLFADRVGVLGVKDGRLTFRYSWFETARKSVDEKAVILKGDLWIAPDFLGGLTHIFKF